MTTPLLTKYYESTIQDGNCGPSEAVGIITTMRVDRDGEVVIPSGGRFDNYRSNPQVMWAHAKGRPEEGEFGLPIATNLWIRASSDGSGLVAKHAFDIEDTFAAKICGKVKRGVLNCYSITFLPLKFGPPTREEISKYPDWAKAKTIYREWELIEYSVVAFPANVEAVNIAKTARKPMSDEAEADAEDEVAPEVVEPAPEPEPEDEGDADFVVTEPEPELEPVVQSKAKANPKEDEDDEEEEPPFKPGDHVKCKAPHYKGYGIVKSVHKDGMVPDVEEDMMGSKEEPACRVKCYKAMNGGHVPTSHHKAMLCKHAEKCDELKAPEERKKAIAEAEAAAPGWSEAEKALYTASRLESEDFAKLIEKKVADLVDTRVLGRA